MNELEKHYRENRVKLCKVMSKRLSNQYHLAEEAVQEAYLRAFKYYHTFDPSIKSFNTWFTTILNMCVTKVGQEERNRGMGLEDVEGVIGEVDYRLTNHGDTLQAVKTVIDSMRNTVHAEVCNLYFTHELTQEEIHQITGVNKLTVNTILRRFKKWYMVYDSCIVGGENFKLVSKELGLKDSETLNIIKNLKINLEGNK